MKEKIGNIPLFPLDLFLLPGEQRMLHIFEERYRQLFEDIEDEGIEFGIPYSQGRFSRNMGCLCRLDKVVQRYAGGESDVLISCTGIFELKAYKNKAEKRLYPVGQVEMKFNEEDFPASDEVKEAWMEYIKAMESTGGQFDVELTGGLFSILSSLSLPDEQKYRFVRTERATWNEQLLSTVRYATLLASQEALTEDGIYLN